MRDASQDETSGRSGTAGPGGAAQDDDAPSSSKKRKIKEEEEVEEAKVRLPLTTLCGSSLVDHFVPTGGIMCFTSKTFYLCVPRLK